MASDPSIPLIVMLSLKINAILSSKVWYGWNGSVTWLDMGNTGLDHHWGPLHSWSLSALPSWVVVCGFYWWCKCIYREQNTPVHPPSMTIRPALWLPEFYILNRETICNSWLWNIKRKVRRYFFKSFQKFVCRFPVKRDRLDTHIYLDLSQNSTNKIIKE